MRTSPPLPVVVALTALLEGLFEAVAARFGIFPIRGPLVRFLWKRLFRIQLHFARLAARIAAGQSHPVRPSRPPASRPARDDGSFRLNKWVNPRFGWLCRIASESIGAAAFAWSLRHLLTTDPDMLALLAATPATARILRPLCWMLGVPASLLEPARDDAAAPPAAGAAVREAPDVPAASPPPADPRPPDPPAVPFVSVVLRAA